jgi:hypothetical protein
MRVTSRARLWYRIAVALSIINLAALGFALGQGEPRHAMVHGLLGAGFAWWASRLRRQPSAEMPDAATLQDQVDQQAAALDDAHAALADQASQIAELQERLDFTERILAQVKERPSLGREEPRQ